MPHIKEKIEEQVAREAPDAIKWFSLEDLASDEYDIRDTIRRYAKQAMQEIAKVTNT
jgi:hypothetical protein